MPYKTLAEIKDWFIGINTTWGFNDDVLAQVRAAFIQSIELDCNCEFETIDEIRYFNGSGTDRLLVDPYTAITTVSVQSGIGGDFIDIPDYKEFRSGNRPKMELLLNHSLGVAVVYAGTPYFGTFPVGNANIKVDATWGFATEVPGDVQLALLYYCMEQNNRLKPDQLALLSGVTIKRIKESDREKEFQFLDVQKSLPRNISYTGLVNRYRVMNRNQRKRKVLL